MSLVILQDVKNNYMKRDTVFFIVILFIFSGTLYAQKNTYNVRINKPNSVKMQNPTNVIITNKIDSEIIYNIKNNSTNKIYILGYRDLTSYVGNEVKNGTSSISEYIFGNPDSLAMNDINFTLKFSKAFDSAYFLNVLPPNTKFNPFNINSPLRDCIKTISSDKKSINFKAGYIKAGQLITLRVYSPDRAGVDTIAIQGAGKLW